MHLANVKYVCKRGRAITLLLIDSVEFRHCSLGGISAEIDGHIVSGVCECGEMGKLPF